MRFFPCLLLVALALPFPVRAEEEKPSVNWGNVESTGTMSSEKDGALEKGLWSGQNRSDIEFLLQRLPDTQPLRSVLMLQKRLLLSTTDATLIKNDIGPLRGNDLLIQRINKLTDMGLYDDAWKLYAQKAEDTYDASIAQVGMTQLIVRNDLATACLEEKVLSAKYPGDKVFAVVDRACAVTMSNDKSPQFPEDPVLQSVYNDPSYRVPASNPQVLEKMNALQRALVQANGSISYTGLTADILKKTPSSFLALYLLDEKMPEAARTLVKAEADARGISYHLAVAAQDDLFTKAKNLKKDPEDQWPVLESAIAAKKVPGDLIPFADMITAGEPKQLSTETLTKALGAMLAAQKPLTDYWLDAAQKRAAEKPIIYIYLQAFQSLTPTPKAAVKVEDFQKALESLKPADSDQILAIITTLDNKAEILNNPLRIYEKHSTLTSSGNYVMPSLGLNVLLDTAAEKKQIGITVMAVLNSLAAQPDNMYSGTVRKALYSMLNVGLIEDAKQIGGETIASVLYKY